MSMTKQKLLVGLIIGSLLSSTYTAWLSYSWYRSLHQNWSLQTVLTSRQQEAKTEFTYEKILQVSLMALITVILLSILIGIFICTNYYHWWIIVLFLSVLCSLEIVVFWAINSERQLQQHEAHLYIENPQALNTFLTKQQKKFITIPTGIVIDQIQFTRSDNSIYPGVLLRGYIWQKYTKGTHDTIERAIILPDMSSGTIDKIFSQQTDTDETIGWNFSGIFFQSFRLSYYPFDHRHVQIQILHKNFKQNVICIPDFNSYKEIHGTLFLGIDAELFIPEWILKRSFFSYTIRNFGCTLGTSEFLYDQFPQYYFYFIVKRDLLDSFILYFVVILMAAIMFFLALMTFEKREALSAMLGFSTAGTLGIISAILFVLIASHMEMRESLSVDGAVYLDYVYALDYLVGIVVSISGLWFALNNRAKTASYNVIMQLLYWPLFLGALLAITIALLY